MNVRKISQRVFGLTGVLLLVAWLGSCQSQTGGARDVETECLRTDSPESADPVGLVACALDGGTGLRFFVGVRNLDEGPLMVRTRLEPFNEFEAQMREVGGEVLPPGDVWEPASLDLERTTYLLPRGGLFGRIVDLTCLQRDFGPRLEPCAAAYQPEAGEFEVSFRYVDIWVCFDDPCDENQTWTGTIESPSLKVVIPEPGT